MTKSIEFYGNDGPIEINTSVVPVLDLWLEAGLEMGYDIGDPNGFQREGKCKSASFSVAIVF